MARKNSHRQRETKLQEPVVDREVCEQYIADNWPLIKGFIENVEALQMPHPASENGQLWVIIAKDDFRVTLNSSATTVEAATSDREITFSLGFPRSIDRKGRRVLLGATMHYFVSMQLSVALANRLMRIGYSRSSQDVQLLIYGAGRDAAQIDQLIGMPNRH